MRGIVILSIFDWWYHPHGHSDIQLAHAFSRRMRVMFVNSIGMRFPRPGNATSPMRRIWRKIRSASRRLTFANPDRTIAVATPIALPIYSGVFGKLNSYFVEWQIRTALKRLKIAKPIVLITVPTYAQVALHLPREALFYNRSDRHSEFVGIDKEMVRRLEETLFREADAVLYANHQLFLAEKDKISGQPVIIGHGVDAALFTPAGPMAPELMDIPPPRVGFFGELCERSINFDLIASVAKLCPEIHFILGGPQLDDLGSLRQLPNIRVLESCPHEEMPGRWRALDAAILPYRRTAWQDASEPIKLNEILSIGLLAVGTAIPAFTRHPGSVRIAEDPASFADNLRQVLAIAEHENRRFREARRAAVSLSSWDSIAEKIDQLSQFVAH